MKIEKFIENQTLTLELIGKLDAVSSVELDNFLQKSLDQIKILVFDLDKLDYIASAGLRILLKYQKEISRCNGVMKIKNIKPEVREIFYITGFEDFLNVVDNNVKRFSIEF